MVRKTHLAPTTNCEVIRKNAVRDPSRQLMSELKIHPICHYERKCLLLRPCDDPLIAFAHSGRLQASHIAPGKCLADCQTNELLPVKDLGNNLRPQLRRPEVEYRRKSYYFSSEEGIDIAPRAKARELKVHNQLHLSQLTQLSYESRKGHLVEVVELFRRNNTAK